MCENLALQALGGYYGRRDFEVVDEQADETPEHIPVWGADLTRPR